MKILIDTREQRPYKFETDTVIGTLATGDYSIHGLQDHISIERKELNDLIGCLSQGRERFERELQRGKGLDYFCLVCECSLRDIAEGAYRSQMAPKAVFESLMAFSIRYRLPIFFCGNRQYAQRVTESLLMKYGREIEKKYNLIGGSKNG